MKKVIILSLLLAMVICLPVSAATFKGAENYTVPSNESIEGNLYAAGAMINVLGNVDGDVMAAGANLRVDGNVTKDVTAAGSMVSVNGLVGDDLRVAGSNIIVNSPVNGDLLVLGAMINIGQNTLVKGDGMIAGGVVDLAGNINGDLEVNAGKIYINGNINGNVVLNADESIEIGENAVIMGNLEYKAPKQDLETSAVKGNVKYNGVLSKTTKSFKSGNLPNVVGGIVGIMMLVGLLNMLLLGILAVLLMPKKSLKVVESVNKNFGNDFLRGLIVLIVVPIAIIILLFTVIGLKLALLAGIVYAGLIIVAKVYAGIILGGLIFKYTSKSKKYRVDWLSAIVGILVLEIIKLIPIVGWIIASILMTAALGNIAMSGYKLLLEKKSK